MSYTYDTLRIRVEDGVAFAAIDNPPINLLDTALIADLARFETEVRDDEAIRVLVFESADPEFFIAHGDMRLVVDPGALAEFVTGPGVELYQRYRTLPQVTIGKVAGRAPGGGGMRLDPRNVDGQGNPVLAIRSRPFAEWEVLEIDPECFACLFEVGDLGLCGVDDQDRRR
ncbi:enoyl-CoA hydratase-related protein [Nocardia sp. NPDC058176]|uniref:enoyl-CoA hydratase-related protein n=1 Tax=Nocardia sp. NPDC058176 TaxID=3346368 RepID=UPI0036DB281A